MKKSLNVLISEVQSEAGRTPRSSISASTQLRDDLGFDSLELALLCVKIEAQFGVDVFACGIINTVGEIREQIDE